MKAFIWKKINPHVSYRKTQSFIHYKNIKINTFPIRDQFNTKPLGLTRHDLTLRITVKLLKLSQWLKYCFNIFTAVWCIQKTLSFPLSKRRKFHWRYLKKTLNCLFMSRLNFFLIANDSFRVVSAAIYYCISRVR